MPKASMKGRVLSIEEKLQVIKEIQSGKKRGDICRDFGLINSVVHNIWKERDKFISTFEQNGSCFQQRNLEKVSDRTKDVFNADEQYVNMEPEWYVAPTSHITLDPLEANFFSPTDLVHIKAEEPADDGMEEGLKVVEMTQQIEVNIVMGENGSYFEDTNGGRWYFANEMRLIDQNTSPTPPLCCDCGGELDVSPNGGPLICVKCTVAAGQWSKPASSAYKSHMCMECNSQFSKFIDLQKHALRHQGKEPKVILTDIFEESSTPVNLPIDLQTENIFEASRAMLHPPNKDEQTLQYVCEVCNKQFTSLRLMKRHSSIHMKCTNIKCKPCVPKVEKKLKKIHAQKKIPPQICVACSKSFPSFELLENHFVEHKGEKSIQCQLCNIWMAGMPELRMHSVVHNYVAGSKICPICGKNYANLKTLRAHSYFHVQGRAFSCDKCEKRFSSELSLQRHMFSHGESPFRCSHCQRLFKNLSRLRRHFCPQQWNIYNERQKTVMTMLATSTTSEKEKSAPNPVKDTDTSCSHCQQEFENSADLKRHICPQQSKIFNNKDNLVIPVTQTMPTTSEKVLSVPTKKADSVSRKKADLVSEHAKNIIKCCKLCQRQFSNAVLFKRHFCPQRFKIFHENQKSVISVTHTEPTTE